MTRIRFQGSLPHAGDSQPFWAPRAKERGRILEGSLTARQSRRGEQLGDSNRVFRDRYAGRLERFDLRLGRAPDSLDNRARMAHSLPGWRRPTGDVGHDGFRAPPLDEVGGFLLGGAANLPDEVDSFPLAALLKHPQGIDHARPADSIPPDPDAASV